MTAEVRSGHHEASAICLCMGLIGMDMAGMYTVRVCLVNIM